MTIKRSGLYVILLERDKFNCNLRLAAREISALLPALQEAGVRLVGVGLEKEGVQEFIDGRFFEGGNK